jgi:hypothetical protein
MLSCFVQGGKMKNKPIENLFRFDYGIEDIDTGQRSRSAKLPDGHPTLIPGRESMGAQVDQYWTPQSLERFIFSLIAPHITDSSVLSPRQFRRALKKIKMKLKARTKKKEFEGDNAWQKALEVMEAEEALMELVNMYYNSLHKA